jgi:hypothetical protein
MPKVLSRLSNTKTNNRKIEVFNYAMKQQCSVYICLLSILLISCLQPHQAESSHKDPNKLMTAETNFAFIFYPSRDLRRKLCEQEIIEDREKRSVCRFEVFGLPLRKGTNQTKSQEVPVHAGMKVREVMDKIGLTAWRGGQPQMRLVKRNLIMQSPLQMGAIQKGAADLERFLTTEVSPGDVVILVAVD